MEDLDWPEFNTTFMDLVLDEKSEITGIGYRTKQKQIPRRKVRFSDTLVNIYDCHNIEKIRASMLYQAVRN